MSSRFFTNHDEQTALEAIVSRILKQKQASAGADVSALEQENNDRVYRLYGLAPDEIKIVEEATPK